jgi:hypothetical protein
MRGRGIDGRIMRGWTYDNVVWGDDDIIDGSSWARVDVGRGRFMSAGSVLGSR